MPLVPDPHDHELEPVVSELHVAKQRPTLGPVRVDVASFAGSTTALVFLWLAFFSLVFPPALIAATVAWVGTLVGILFPNDK